MPEEQHLDKTTTKEMAKTNPFRPTAHFFFWKIEARFWSTGLGYEGNLGWWNISLYFVFAIGSCKTYTFTKRHSFLLMLAGITRENYQCICCGCGSIFAPWANVFVFHVYDESDMKIIPAPSKGWCERTLRSCLMTPSNPSIWHPERRVQV